MGEKFVASIPEDFIQRYEESNSTLTRVDNPLEFSMTTETESHLWKAVKKVSKKGTILFKTIEFDENLSVRPITVLIDQNQKSLFENMFLCFSKESVLNHDDIMYFNSLNKHRQ